MRKFQHKDEVQFYHEKGNLTGTVILSQSGKILVACCDDLKSLPFVPMGWYTGKQTYLDMVDAWGESSTINVLYAARIEPLNYTHLFKWFNDREVSPIETSYTLDELLNRLEDETR